MDNKEYIQNLLGSLAKQLDSPESAHINEQGDALVDLDGRQYMIRLSNDAHDVLISAPVSPLPEGKCKATVLRELLASNYSWGASGGGILNVDNQKGWVFLIRKFALTDINENTFANNFGIMRCHIKYWDNLIHYLEDSADKKTHCHIN